MSDIAIEVSHVWKKFRRGELHDSLRDLIPSMVKRLMGRAPNRDELTEREFWALKDVSFQVKRGEALGIIGPNGAGKSTMLKILSRVLRPTRGEIAVRGRVGALIEVAAGFHPDLTGRENVYLQGAIMGMKRSEIVRKLDEIIEFAGLSEFIDTPVKRYSSGMHARLGFSIAAHLDPEVLLIDEVLSVGDMAFQERCVKRMREFKCTGVAIIFVSHNMQAVADLCERSVYLDGNVRAHGITLDVIGRYISAVAHAQVSCVGSLVEVTSAMLVEVDGRPARKAVPPGAPLLLRLTFVARESVSDLTFGFIVRRSTDNLVVYDGNVLGKELGLGCLIPDTEFTIDFAFRAHLTRGQYHLECHVYHNPTQRFLARLCPAGILTVQESRSYAGIADVELECRLAQEIPADGTLPSRGRT